MAPDGTEASRETDPGRDCFARVAPVNGREAAGPVEAHGGGRCRRPSHGGPRAADLHAESSGDVRARRGCAGDLLVAHLPGGPNSCEGRARGAAEGETARTTR